MPNNCVDTTNTGLNYGIIHEMSDANYYGQAFQEAETLLVEKMALETRKKDQTLHMSRAFPACKLYFIEKDNNEWRMFDNFYSYSAIKSILAKRSIISEVQNLTVF